MTVEERRSYQAREYAEAIRYMNNAEEILKKSKKDGDFFEDKKYVRSACGTAYSGVLVALDAWLTLKDVDVSVADVKTARQRSAARKKQISFYCSNLAKLDKKMLDHLDSVYLALHLNGYYDGCRDARIIKPGFECAYWIINQLKPAA